MGRKEPDGGAWRQVEAIVALVVGLILSFCALPVATATAAPLDDTSGGAGADRVPREKPEDRSADRAEQADEDDGFVIPLPPLPPEEETTTTTVEPTTTTAPAPTTTVAPTTVAPTTTVAPATTDPPAPATTRPPAPATTAPPLGAQSSDEADAPVTTSPATTGLPATSAPATIAPSTSVAPEARTTTPPPATSGVGAAPPTALVSNTGGGGGGAGGVPWPPLWQTLVLVDLALIAMVAIGLYRRGIGA